MRPESGPFRDWQGVGSGLVSNTKRGPFKQIGAEMGMPFSDGVAACMTLSRALAEKPSAASVLERAALTGETYQP